MAESFDLFFSYASADRAQAEPLVAALRAAGLTVWFDQDRIDDFQPIQSKIAEGLARSKALLAFYSRTYATRRVCAWELTAALIAKGQSLDRILVVNPEADGASDHILPRSLLEHRVGALLTGADPAALAQAAAQRLAGLAGPMGAAPEAAATQPWAGLPRRGGPQHFIGRRREIWAIHDGLAEGSVLLSPSLRDPAPRGGEALLRGLGGVGKSLLAEEYARRFAAAWPGGVFWLRAGGELHDGAPKAEQDEAQRDGQYALVAAALGVTVPPGGPAALRQAVTRALKAGAPYLWLVDDLPPGLSAEQVQAWFAPSAQGRSLITTRDSGLDALARAIPIEGLEADDAYALLTLTRPPRDPAEETCAREIIAALGGHALAVDVARHLVAKGGYALLAEGLRAPDAAALELAAQLRLVLPNGHEVSIAATLLRSLRQLTSAQLDPLRLAALGAPNQPLPAAFLAAVLTAAEGTAVSQGEALVRIDGAAAHSLCEYGDGQYQVHGLVSRVIRQLYSDDRLTALRAAMLTTLLDTLPAPAKDIRRHGEIAALIAHAQALAASPQTETEADLLGWVGHFLQEAGNYSAAKTAYGEQLDAHRRLLGPEHPETLTSMINLAGSCRYAGDYISARDMQDNALLISNNIFGEWSVVSMHCAHELSESLVALGEYSEAIQYMRGILRYNRIVLGGDHQFTMRAMSSLASALRLVGKYEEAEKIQQEDLDISIKLLGECHPDTMTSMENLGLIYFSQGNFDKAKNIQEKVYVLRCKMLGEEHPVTISGLSNLALTLFSQGNYDNAKFLQRRAHAIMIKVLGVDHHSTLTNMGNLSETLRVAGEYGEAEMIQRKILSTRCEVLGEDHPLTQVSAGNLSLILFEKGEYVSARELACQVLNVRRRILGAEHPDTLTSMGNLAQIYLAQGDYDAAHELEGEALALRRRILGVKHPNTITSISNMARILAAQDNLCGARTMYEEALTLSLQVLGVQHPHTLIRIDDLILTLLDIGDYASALPLVEEALEIRRNFLGVDHHDVVITELKLASILCYLGNFVDAHKIEVKILNFRRKLLGENHINTLSSKANVSIMLEYLNQPFEALELMNQVVQGRKKALGSEHPDTRAAEASVAYLEAKFRDALSPSAHTESRQ